MLLPLPPHRASPAAVLLVAPLALGGTTTPAAAVGTAVLVVGALLPLRHVFNGLRVHEALLLMLVAGAGTGLLTVLTGKLATQQVGIGPIYVVRTAAAAGIFWLLYRPRDVRASSLPQLPVRSATVSTGFVLTIMAVQRGAVLLVQCLLATTPLLVAAMESAASRRRPSAAVVAAGLICSVGVAVLATGAKLSNHG